MTRARLLSIAVVALVMLNLITLGVLVFRKPPHPEHGEHEGPKAVIIERLKFDADQVTAYEELIHDHRGMIDALDERMTELRGRLYGAHDALPKDSLIAMIARTQGEIERTHADHFGLIRALCRPEQLPLFDAMTKDLTGYFRPGAPPPGDHR